MNTAKQPLGQGRGQTAPCPTSGVYRVICKQGETYQDIATITLERAATTLVFKQEPALICETCGEEYVAEGVTTMLFAHAEEAIKAGVEVDVRYYRAA